MENITMSTGTQTRRTDVYIAARKGKEWDSEGEQEKKKERHITHKPITEIIEMVLNVNVKADGWGTGVEMLHRGSSVTRLSVVGDMRWSG